MTMSFNTDQIIALIGVLLTLVFSTIGVIQAGKSNKIAKKSNKIANKSNEIAKKANDISESANEVSKKEKEQEEKKNGSILIFTDTISLETLSFEETVDKVVFDFAGHMEDEMDYVDDVIVIKASIMNKGYETIHGINFKTLHIFAGDEYEYRNNQSCERVLMSSEGSYFNKMLINKDEPKDIYFSIPEDFCDGAKDFFAKNKDVILLADIELYDAVGSITNQNQVTAYIRENIVKKCEY